MLAGRYPSDEFAELRPRIVWDRTAGVVKGRQGARRLAVTNAGTIPDRGLFGVFQVDGGGRVGELDEEMVYEARQGQTFMLGASTWRIEEITRDRVLVSPAPGAPGAVPFWKGEGVGRPFELGEKIGRASREIVALSDRKALERLGSDYHLDPLAAKNLLTYLRDQAAANGGVVPSDRTIVVERFRDEIGDWRLCILTPFGARVHAPWAMALGARLRDALGLEVQSIWSDDGIALHLPEADVLPPIADLLLTPDEIEELVVQEVGSTALFGARFRENAARALLIPRRRPGQRTPLWQQRLKAQSLLQVARNYGSFPIVLETYRECLQDVFDLPALKRILHGIQTRELDLVEVETPSASPFASSLLFAYVATYMYEDDTPAAERRAQALSLDRDLLRELLGQEELRDLLDPEALAEVEAQLAGDPRSPDELHDLLRRRGDLRDDEVDAAHAAVLEAERRALRVRVAGEERLIAVEDAGLFRDALGVMPPGGLPEAYLDAVPDALGVLLGRFARSRGPFTTAEAAARYALEPGRRRGRPARARARRQARPRRASPRRRRARVVRPRRPAAPAARLARGAAQGGRACRAGGARAVPARLARDRPARQPARGARPAAGAAAAGVALGERGAAPPRAGLPARLARRALRHRRGRLGRGGARPCRALLPIRCAAARRAGRRAPARGGDGAGACATRSRGRPSSGPTCSPTTGLDAEAALPALWELVWAGEVTNDAWTPLRAARRYGTPVADRRPRRFSRTRAAGTTSTQGRWSLTARLFPTAVDRRALAELLLERQGIVVRDGVRGEGIAGGYGAVYGELRALETIGSCRRGYFVEGLGGAQFALAGAVERLRELRTGAEDDALVLAAADPAQPYGAALPWPRRAGARAARVAGAHVVLLGGVGRALRRARRPHARARCASPTRSGCARR